MEVSTDHLDVACRPEPMRWRVAHDRAGMAACLAPLRQRKPARSGLEATGGGPYAWVAARAVATRPVAVLHPRHIREVAKATGPLATTDARAAGGIAPVAAAGRPTPRPRPDARTPPMDARLLRRRPRLERVVAARQRVALAHATVRASLARQMDALQQLIHATEEAVATRIRTSPAWHAPEDV